MASGSGSEGEGANRFVKAVRDRLKCLACSDYLFPRAQQCENEHLLCQYCFRDTANCQICGKAKIYDPVDDTLQNLQQILDFPCRFSKYGCNYQNKCSALECHEKGCTFTHFKCPFEFEECKFKSTKELMSAHLKEIHSDRVTTKHTKKITLDKFSEDRIDRKGCFVFFLYGDIFCAFYEVDIFSGHARFSVGMLGQKQKGRRLCYKVGFFDTKTKVLGGVVLKGDCSYIYHERFSIDDKDYEEIHMKYLNQYCCEESGDLQILIAIKEVTTT